MMIFARGGKTAKELIIFLRDTIIEIYLDPIMALICIRDPNLRSRDIGCPRASDKIESGAEWSRGRYK